jgi:exonuclease III
MSDRSKLRGQTKGVSNSSGFGGRLVSPPVKMCSPRNLIQGLRVDGNDLKHGNWIMILAHGTYDHYKTGALQSLLYEMQKYKLELLTIQETRWLGQGVHDYKEFTIFHSGDNDDSHELGTIFIVGKKLRNNVIDFWPINERICALHMKTKFHNMWLINAHGPTEEKVEDIKDDFYKTLEHIYNALPKNDIKLIVGDFNAKIGEEEIYKGIIGKHSLHAISNDNGERAIKI